MRTLPWLQEQARRRPHSVETLLDCNACKKMNTIETRQAIGCGYELPVDGARAWLHQGQSPEHDDTGAELPRTCPGYTCKLPEVVEMSRLRAHWRHGALRDACDGQPTAHVLDAVLILDGAASEMESWTLSEEGRSAD